MKFRIELNSVQLASLYDMAETACGRQEPLADELLCMVENAERLPEPFGISHMRFRIDLSPAQLGALYDIVDIGYTNYVPLAYDVKCIVENAERILEDAKPEAGELTEDVKPEVENLAGLLHKTPYQINDMCDTGVFNEIIEGYCRKVFIDLGLLDKLDGYSFSELFDNADAATARMHSDVLSSDDLPF